MESHVLLPVPTPRMWLHFYFHPLAFHPLVCCAVYDDTFGEAARMRSFGLVLALSLNPSSKSSKIGEGMKKLWLEPIRSEGRMCVVPVLLLVAVLRIWILYGWLFYGYVFVPFPSQSFVLASSSDIKVRITCRGLPIRGLVIIFVMLNLQVWFLALRMIS